MYATLLSLPPNYLWTWFPIKRPFLTRAVLQLYFFCSLVDTESFLLAAMVYDRYIAICNPLLYKVIMSKRVCCQLAIGAFLGGTMSSIIHTTNTFHLSFCSKEINHFFCDISPLFSSSCTDTYMHDIILVVFAGLVEAICLLTVLLSYVCIIAAILKTSSVKEEEKGFPLVPLI